MKPSMRYLLIALVLCAFAALTLRMLLRAPGDAPADGRAGEPLQRVALVAADVRANAEQLLQLRTSNLASDPAFSSYVLQAMDPGAAPGGAIDRASIVDLLRSRREGFDLAMVLDAHGRLVASDGAAPETAAQLPGNALVKRTLATRKSSTGAWVSAGELYWVAVDPLVRGGLMQGLLLTAARVDAGYTATISRHTGMPVALLIADGERYRIASGHALPGWAASTLADAATARNAAGASVSSGDTLAVPHRVDTVARIIPISTTSGDALLVALAGAPPTPLLGVGPALWVFLLGAAMVLWHWWRVERPLDLLSERIGAVAHGRRAQQFAVRGSASVRRLARQLNRLFSAR